MRAGSTTGRRVCRRRRPQLGSASRRRSARRGGGCRGRADRAAEDDFLQRAILCQRGQRGRQASCRRPIRHREMAAEAVTAMRHRRRWRSAMRSRGICAVLRGKFCVQIADRVARVAGWRGQPSSRAAAPGAIGGHADRAAACAGHSLPVPAWGRVAGVEIGAQIRGRQAQVGQQLRGQTVPFRQFALPAFRLQAGLSSRYHMPLVAPRSGKDRRATTL